ncbi:sigma-70 non-essential region-containing protein, partial [Enterobacter hormaechei]|nr:sigma-70 non-essential region-containing protein [Enterobacter hormaechei]
NDQLVITLKVLKKHGRTHAESIGAMQALADLFMPIKLVPKQFDALVERVRSALDRLRQQERAIMQLCVRDARMPRADFLRLFPSNETDQTWSGDLAKRNTKWAAALGEKDAAIVACQQKLIDLETETGLTVA